ncbi:hypothetical protein ACNKHO_00245 [Shigella flexneri]
MPKRTDIKSILILGAGPIVIGQACELTIPVRRHVKPCVKRVTASFW